MKEKHKRRALLVVTALCQIIVGATFVFSGFVKAVDPWGTLYKFEEYLSAMGVPMIHTLLIVGVFGLCAAEFIIGMALLLRCYRRSAPILALTFMAVMLPLTLWIAIKNPVSDCGCFGDFLLISNWATFWKNVVLTTMVVWLLKYNRLLPPIITPALQWIGFVVEFGFIICVSVVGYKVQPLLDFRPYHIGEQLVGSDDEEDTAIKFIYEKDGVRKEFGIEDELPDEAEGWSFVERIEGMNESSGDEGGKTLRIWDRQGDEDVTEAVISSDSPEILLLMPQMSTVSPATTWKINAINDWINARGGTMIAIVDGSSDQIDEWEDMSLADYDIYTADDTAIKEVSRGNPAVVLLNNGIIEWKSALAAIDVEEMAAQGAAYKPSGIVTHGSETMKDIVWIFLICLAVPIFLSWLPDLRKLYNVKALRRGSGRKARVTRDDKARPEE